jgi:hypothetical protein
MIEKPLEDQMTTIEEKELLLYVSEMAVETGDALLNLETVVKVLIDHVSEIDEWDQKLYAEVVKLQDKGERDVTIRSDDSYAKSPEQEGWTGACIVDGSNQAQVGKQALAGQARASAEILLRQRYPNGHPKFLPITLAEIALHDAKNHDYTKGGNSLGNFERVSTILGLYPNLKLSDQRVVALVAAMKQLDAVLWGLNSGIIHKVEGANERLRDISVYAKIVQCMNEDLAEAKAGPVAKNDHGASVGPGYLDAACILKSSKP